MSDVLIDTSIVIALLRKELSREGVESLLGRRASISIITFCEACRYFHLAGKARQWNDYRAELAGLEVIPLTQEISENAARLAVNKHLALADSIIYATAREKKLILVTRDADDFKKLPGVEIVT